MKDPYKILGISPDATDDDVKRAYRELAKKYHPDNYADSPLADMAEEKMKEINQAYDDIIRMREEKKTTFEGNRTYEDASDRSYTEIRRMINSGNFAQADVILDYISEPDRGAEWNFLKGVVLIQKGWYFDARRYLETACYMAPNNAEYRAALEKLKMQAGGTTGSYRTVGNDSCDACDVCQGLICADCLCECCGGDLISCC